MPTSRLPLWSFGLMGAVTMAGVAVILAHSDARVSNLRLLAAAGVLAALPLGSLWSRRGRRRVTLLAIWVGCAVAILTAGVIAGGAVNQAAAFLASFAVALPLLVGALCQALLEDGRALLRGRASPSDRKTEDPA